MSLLQEYQCLREALRKQIEEGNFPSRNMLLLQELNYRIELLETFQNFCQTAPVTQDMSLIAFHHQLILAFVSKIVSERALAERPDEATAKRRETALNAFSDVVKDCKNRFSSFRATADDEYKNKLTNFINTILPVWLQYRTSLVDLNALRLADAIPSRESEKAPITEFDKAIAVNCPIKKYAGKTLGDLLMLDPNALKWLATVYEDDATVKAAAKYICEYAIRKSE